MRGCVTHRDIQVCTGKIRRESEFSPACSGVSQSPERWGRCDHCLVTAQHCNQSGAHAGKWCLAT